jgi:hypothetical protein
MSNTERYRGHRRVISSVSDETATLTMPNAERYRGHRRVISSVSDQTATDSDVIRYYDLQVKLSLYPHMRNVWFNGVEQCPATQLMNSFHTCEQAKSAEKRREIRKQSLGLKHNNKEKETREFEIRFQKEEKEKRYQEFKRKKEKSKYTDAEAIPIAVAIPLLVVENVA